ncbi:MAG: InlB B-repeat-containing protein [Spirochaetia bacterium]|nr:InlB B-repeat-containing protein [Spirochaetia bacterium]
MIRNTIKNFTLFLFIFLFLFSLLTCNDEKKKVSTTTKDEKLSFIISYKSNGADFGTAPISQEGNEELPQKIKFNEGNLLKSGFLFDGWNSAADGSGTDYAPGTSYTGKSITLYAKWKTATYNDYLSIAKDFKNKGQWCHALGAYYDALGTDGAPESKIEAYNAYNELADEIRKGNPGIGQFNVFTQHDEWKKMLIDAEKYGSEIVPYIVEVGKLKQKKLDYQTKTATYSANIMIRGFNDRYEKTIAIIEAGYKKAFKKDWVSDLPKPDNWPRISVSSKGESTYDENESLIITNEKNQNTFFNAFSFLIDNSSLFIRYYSLFVYVFNIVDENGNALVNKKRLLLASQDEIVFSEIKPEVMDLIDNGKAWVSPVVVYLNYGKYNDSRDEKGRPVIKYLKERQLPLDKAVFVGDHCNDDIAAINVAKVINIMKH